MTPASLLIRGGDVVDGTGAPRRQPTCGCAPAASSRSAPGLRPDGEDRDRRRWRRRRARLHRHPRPHRPAGVLGSDPRPRSAPRRDHDARRQLQPSLYPANRRRPASEICRPVRVHRGRPAPPLRRRRAVDVDRLRRLPRQRSNATGTGLNLAALVGHSPIRLAVMGDDAWTRVADGRPSAPRWPRCSTTRWHAGAWGLSTSFLDVDQARPSGALPRRRRRRVRRALDVDRRARPRPGRVRARPARSRPRDVVRRPGPPVRRARHPAHVDRLRPLRPRPGRDRSGGSTSRTSLARAEGIRFYPQLSPRTVDFRLNWDSSMMFMSMPEGWHRGRSPRAADDKADAPARPRVASRSPATNGTAPRRRMFPHRRTEMVRFVEVVGAENEPWLGRTLAELVAERGGHPSDVFADFVLANDCRPGVVAVGMANADVDGRGPYARRSRGAHQLVRCRRAHADAVRVGRHHAAAHPPRARARRLHARAGGATS